MMIGLGILNRSGLKHEGRVLDAPEGGSLHKVQEWVHGRSVRG